MKPATMQPADTPDTSSASDKGISPAFDDASSMIDLLHQVAEANLRSPLRSGATVHLPSHGRLLVTGDLHDHGLNLQRIIKLARLDESRDHHLILHEIIHGPQRIHGRDMSILTLARVAALKLQYPDQVHLMQSNHELAQLGGEGISKAGVNVVDVFNDGLDFIYEHGAAEVRAALDAYIRSLVLAVRCPNGVLCSHSLPSPSRSHSFDTTVLNRALTDRDLRYGGSAYRMVWGRRHTQDWTDALAKAWDVKLFLLGHQPADQGYQLQGHTTLILASNHDRGMALPINLAKSYEMDDLISRLIPLASITA